MFATLMSRTALPYLALAAACGVALAFGVTSYIQREPIHHEAAPEANATTAAPQASSPTSTSASSGRTESPSALAAAQAEANALSAQLSSPPPDAKGSEPAFDVARIEPTGDAVIAGRAAPGATVELMRNGERLDEAVADKSGQFVMVPSRLPSGDYELTLRSRLPDGTLATSQQGVKVALAEAEPNSGADQSRPEVPSDVTGATATASSSQDHAVMSSQARVLSEPSSHPAEPQHVALSEPPSSKTAGRQSDEGSSSAVVPPRSTTSVVARGDSLWRISRATYGDGALYARVYKANRDRIRNPNLIYPGQIFVLPRKTQ